jgi:NADPH:quinone reductase-like Zn-dependent oxidoreductase
MLLPVAARADYYIGPMADDLPVRMRAVLLTGHGGYERLVYRDDVPVPAIAPGEVLIEVAAAGVNNTDVNTRIAWYSKGVQAGTNEGALEGFAVAAPDDSSWTGSGISFPRIQGADCCGRIVAVADEVDATRVGERVLVRPIMRSPDAPPPACWTLGSERDGAFAEYTTAPAQEVFRVDCDWRDAELASIPCAFSTAENLLQRAEVTAGDRILVTGASGGVGSAAVQLAKRRGSDVVAVVGEAKQADVLALGADAVVTRGGHLRRALGPESVDVVVDLVGGPEWHELLVVLRRGGRLATAGAIAGPIVELDLRTLYLKDLTLVGATYQDEAVFSDLVGYVERGEIRPIVARTYPLREIVQAQRDFVAKRFTGKLVLVVRVDDQS